jgi:phage/plasmid-like protein (TIGR03299 family)
MAHDLAETDRQVAVAYFGETPWHGLGTKLNHPATAGEAIEAAGLHYQAELVSLETKDGIAVPGRKAVVRSDTREVLGVVGSSYVPIQNGECFSFLDAVVAEGNVRYHTAGALGKGERIWLLAKLPGNIQVQNTEDVTEKFLLLHNSHNGSSALRVFFTPIRVVCANTLAIAQRKGRGQGIAIQHKGNLAAKVRQSQKVLGLANRFYDDVQVKVDALAGHYPTASQLKGYFEALYPNPLDGKNKRAENIRSELFRLFEEGKGQDIPGIRHSAWAAYHAVTEWVDHYRTTRTRSPEDRASRRLQSLWFGSGAKLKAEAWDLALDMASSPRQSAD